MTKAAGWRHSIPACDNLVEGFAGRKFRVCSAVGYVPIVRDQYGRVITRSGLVVSLPFISQTRFQRGFAMPGRSLQAVTGAVTV